jgi:hypothetical protein
MLPAGLILALPLLPPQVIRFFSAIGANIGYNFRRPVFNLIKEPP